MFKKIIVATLSIGLLTGAFTFNSNFRDATTSLVSAHGGGGWDN